METASDLAVFFDKDDFAVECEWTRSGQTVAERKFSGIFDNEHVELGLDGEATVNTTNPVFHCATADLPTGHARGDRAKIENVSYKVRDFQPDGTGATLVILEKP